MAREEGDVEIKIDPGSDEEEEVEDEEEGEEGTGSDGKKREKANEKDGGGDDAGPEITRRATRGMADASNVPVRRRDSRETQAVEPRGVAVSRGTGLDGGRPRRRRPPATRRRGSRAGFLPNAVLPEVPPLRL